MKTCFRRLIVLFSLATSLCWHSIAAAQVGTDAIWVNPATGILAGDWFDGGNWDTLTVPNTLNNALINNGGEAKADSLTAVGIVNATGLSVGTNGGTGVFTDNGVSVFLFGTMDVGGVDSPTASSIANVTSNGTAAIHNTASILVAGNIIAGGTGSPFGIKDATGMVTIDTTNLLQVGGGMDLGAAFSSGGQDNGQGTVMINDAGTISVTNALRVGVAGANTSGTGTGDGTLVIQRATNLTIGSTLGVGFTQATSDVGTANATGSASLSDVDNISIGGGLFIGRTFAKDDVVTNAIGTLTIDRSNSISVVGDFDVGQTGTSGLLGTGLALATGTATATIRDVIGAMTVGGDIDVGQTSSRVSTTASGNGTLVLERLGSLSVATDFDVGQVGGQGQTTATGHVTITDIGTIAIGVDLDVGQTRGSTSAMNQGQGTVFITNATVNIGFGDPLLPGGLDIGNVNVLASELGHGSGAVTMNNVVLQVADRINVGELVGGGTNVGTTSNGVLNLIASLATTPTLDVATIIGSTAGAVTGRLHLNPSLLNVTGTMSLGAGSTLAMDIAGATRADGTGGLGQYSAINAGIANLAGTLEVNLDAAFSPSPNNLFTLLSFTSRLGEFDAVTGAGLQGNVFLLLQYGVTDVTLLAALPGDANLSGVVDIGDFTVWADGFQIGTAFTDGDFNGDGVVDIGDFTTWADNFGRTAGAFGSPNSSVGAVPEPSTFALLGIAVLAFAAHGCRRRRDN